MDFNSLIRGALPTFGANASRFANGSAEDGIPDGILETLTPILGFQFNPILRLLMVLNNMVGGNLGLDPTFVLASFGFVWAVNKLWAQLYMNFYALARQHFMASVQVSSSDDIYSHLMKWLASQPNMVNSRSLAAETASKGAWEEEDDSNLTTARMSPDGSDVLLNFSIQEAKAAPRFTPALGSHTFWFRGRYFTLLRKQETLYDGAAGVQGMPQYKEQESLVLSCFGRSPVPIKQLLQHAKEQFYLDHQAKTIVRRPAPQAYRRYGHRHSWQQVANRPVRPMRTVVLDDEQKIRVLSDMNEYLHPATPRWYANRGIPLRRGYLFHGPPGTGKTSLSFALAGVFGLDIYVISLLDPTLTEEDLLALFTSLPRRCVVLLEDIDTAGLRRVEDSSSDDDDDDDEDDKSGGERDKTDGKGKKAKKSRHKSKKDWKVSDLARELKKRPDPGEKKGISLSGLLNAIDGVASHEGRVLIMTTNKPETLDEALIRPGRVDLQVAFTNATQRQARELFVRMYEHDGSNKATTTLDGLSMLSVPPPTPFPELPPTPLSLSSEKDGNLTDVSGATEVDDDAVIPLLQTGTVQNNPTNNKPAPLKLGPSSNHHPYSLADPDDNATDPCRLDEAEKEQQPDEDNASHHHQPSPAELARIAGAFAARIPSGQFSPAELQGFLLKRKKTPRRALAEVDGWVRGMQVQKASRTKVVLVQ